MVVLASDVSCHWRPLAAVLVLLILSFAAAQKGKGAAPRRLPGLHRRGSSPIVRFEDVYTVAGTSFDLVVFADGDYTPFDAAQNGNTGRIGNVNVKVGTKVNLILKFLESGTEIPAKMDRFFLSLYLVDQRQKVRVRYYSSHGTAAGFREFCLSKGTVLKVDIEEDPASTTFTAPFGKSTEPSDPSALTEAEKNQAVTFLLHDAFEIPIAVDVAGGLMEDSGINFALSPTDSIKDACHPWEVRAESTSPAVSSSEPFNCHTGVEHREREWSAPKRKWCCNKGGVDCYTCGDEDVGAWSTDKREWCCRHQTIGCTTTTAAKARSVKETGGHVAGGNATGCDTTCIQNGFAATCKKRVDWVAKNQYQDQAKPCDTAYTLVKDICPVCTVCSREDACAPPNATHQTTTAKLTTSTEHYDCDHGESSWTKSWSDEKKEWCCEKHSKGCTTTTETYTVSTTSDTTTTASTTTATVTGTTTMTTLPYNCSPGRNASHDAWSDEKQAWCCKHQGVGCTVTTTTATFSSTTTTTAASTSTVTSTTTVTTSTTMVTTSTLPRYDCERNFSDWESVWSYDKRTWCCQQFSRGCRYVPLVSTTTPEPFDCTGNLTTEKESWTKRKQEWCCKHHSQGCSSQRHGATEAGSADTTCRSRSCTTTHSVPPEEFDCQHGYKDWANNWTYRKKAWCCQHYARGCRFVPNSGSERYNCKEGVSSSDAQDDSRRLFNLAGLLWGALGGGHHKPTTSSTSKEGWSHQQRRWCCLRYQTGCSGVKGDLFNCEGDPEGWDYTRRTWCCQHRGSGCRVGAARPSSASAPYNCTASVNDSVCDEATTSEPYNCEAGFVNWADDWSYKKKVWCCRQYARGCHYATTSEPFACKVGAEHWKQGWSSSKKEYCCRVHHRGCPETTSEPYDCTAGFSTWQIGWSTNKQTWCCQRYARGCPAPPRKQMVLADGGHRQPATINSDGFQRLFGASQALRETSTGADSSPSGSAGWSFRWSDRSAWTCTVAAASLCVASTIALAAAVADFSRRANYTQLGAWEDRSPARRPTGMAGACSSVVLNVSECLYPDRAIALE